jgi:DNA-binding GntR family transcriptional regulator
MPADPTPGGEIGRTLAERIAEVLRDRILSLAAGHRPADRLYSNRLAEGPRVNVTPVREALKLLAAQGSWSYRPGAASASRASRRPTSTSSSPCCRGSKCWRSV